MHPLISASDAIQRAKDDKTIIFDASFHLPNAGRDAEEEFLDAHIPNAQRFDIDDIAMPSSDLPHTMPSSSLFQRHMQMRGVNQGSHVIVYDDSDVKSAARAWFMFRYFGHENVPVLDGGLSVWRMAGGETSKAMPSPPSNGDFIAKDPAPSLGMVSVNRLKKIVDKPLKDRPLNILDARAEGRFLGRDPEPRPGLAGGHMPGAINVPFQRLIDPETGCYQPAHIIEEIFKEVDLDKGIITTCGSGITACVLILGLTIIGRQNLNLYDGSWVEWGSRKDCPVSV